jgi:hypothetical protein
MNSLLRNLVYDSVEVAPWLSRTQANDRCIHHPTRHISNIMMVQENQGTFPYLAGCSAWLGECVRKCSCMKCLTKALEIRRDCLNLTPAKATTTGWSPALFAGFRDHRTVRAGDAMPLQHRQHPQDPGKIVTPGLLCSRVVGDC